MNGYAYHTAPRVAIVTGASKGIGRDIALRLADDGLDVTINSRNAEELQVVAREIEAKGRKVLPYVGDVSEEDVVQGMVEKTVAILGRLDVVSRSPTAPFEGCILTRRLLDGCERWYRGGFASGRLYEHPHMTGVSCTNSGWAPQ